MDRRANEFLKLTTVTDVQGFLNRCGESHSQGYYHYTALQAIRGMLTSKMLHLSLGSRLNDLSEPLQKSHHAYAKWSHSYVASFAFGKMENIAMWAMYGNPFRDAARIRFDKTDLLADVQEFKNHGQVYNAVKLPDGTFDYRQLNDKFDISVHDVAYWTGRSLFWDGNTLSSMICPDIESTPYTAALTGYIKNYAWHYEHETRIVVSLPNMIFNPPKTIAIPLEKAIQRACITLGPCTTRKRFNQILGQEWDGLSESILKGMVQLRCKCERCEVRSECPMTQY